MSVNYVRLRDGNQGSVPSQGICLEGKGIRVALDDAGAVASIVDTYVDREASSHYRQVVCRIVTGVSGVFSGLGMILAGGKSGSKSLVLSGAALMILSACGTACCASYSEPYFPISSALSLLATPGSEFLMFLRRSQTSSTISEKDLVHFFEVYTAGRNTTVA